MLWKKDMKMFLFFVTCIWAQFKCETDLKRKKKHLQMYTFYRTDTCFSQEKLMHSCSVSHTILTFCHFRLSQLKVEPEELVTCFIQLTLKTEQAKIKYMADIIYKKDRIWKSQPHLQPQQHKNTIYTCHVPFTYTAFACTLRTNLKIGSSMKDNIIYLIVT